ncbi:MAG TPA: VCBS repeat-containing protein, partial [Thermoanaerobaculia bacterium]
MRRAFGVAPGLLAAALAGWVFLAAAPEKKTPAPKKPSPDAGCPVVFTDVAAQAGLKFVHERGATPNHQLPETMGSGLAWLDYDNDGWMDLYVVQSGPFPASGAPRLKNRLYHNNHDGTFTDVTEKAGLKDASYGMGVVAADYDNDGYVDLFV